VNVSMKRSGIPHFNSHCYAGNVPPSLSVNPRRIITARFSLWINTKYYSRLATWVWQSLWEPACESRIRWNSRQVITQALKRSTLDTVHDRRGSFWPSEWLSCNARPLGVAHARDVDSGNPNDLPSLSGNQYVFTGTYNSLEDMWHALLRNIRWKRPLLCRLMCTKKKSLARTQYHTSRAPSLIARTVEFPLGGISCIAPD
jgi:hypothetical protein